MDSKLVKNLINANYKRSAGDDFADGIGGTVKVYTVETDSSRCKFWNSSNNSSFELALSNFPNLYSKCVLVEYQTLSPLLNTKPLPAMHQRVGRKPTECFIDA